MISKNVVSATKYNLIMGIIFVIMILMLEFACVYNFMTGDNLSENISISIFLNITIIPICYLVASCLFKTYKNRKYFNIYAIELNNNVDIDDLKNRYYICDITEKGILYIEKDDYEAFSDFKFSRRDVNYYTFTTWYEKITMKNN